MVYHEKQTGLLCAMHVVNNLLQKAVFSKKDLDAIADELGAVSASSAPSQLSLLPLTWRHPHRGIFGGNYDINVLTTALNRHQLSLSWFDQRKPLSSIDLTFVKSGDDWTVDQTASTNITLPATSTASNTSVPLAGFIINLPPTYLWSARHWFAIRRVYDPTLDINGWWNLDSRLDTPLYIGTNDDLLNYLDTLLNSQDHQSSFRIPILSTESNIQLFLVHDL
ncbi:Josephin-domain-containing protein [Syncephalis fuscata]|nr:Josephin-domain-containing protein [Syncephalis fuscata]